MRTIGRGGAPPDPGNATGAVGRGAGKAKVEIDNRERPHNKLIRPNFNSAYRKSRTLACLVRTAILRCGGQVRL
jgi:hypothetical protein